MDTQRTAAAAGREGVVLVISAPSGAGKTSLCRRLARAFPDLSHSVSYTTRQRREGERDGVDYHFVAPERFRAMIAAGDFAEWAEVHGNLYGTALRTLNELREQGRDVLLDIDCQGAAQLKATTPGAVFVFILPPDYDELRRRLEGRGTEARETIAQRIANARGEIREACWYDYTIINDELEQAFTELRAILVAERIRTHRLQSRLNHLFPAEFAPARDAQSSPPKETTHGPCHR